MTAAFDRTRRVQRAYVVFQDRSNFHLASAYCRRGWRHCWVMLPFWHPEPGLLAEPFTVKVEPLGGHVDVLLWAGEAEAIAREFYEAGVTAIVEIDTVLPPGGGLLGYIPRGVYSCVTLAKSVIGLRNWRVVTPWGLYLALIRNGGRLIT